MATCTQGSLGYSELIADSGSYVQATILSGNPCKARYVYDDWSGNGGGGNSSKQTLLCTVRVNGQHVDFSCPGVSDEIPTG